MDLQNLVSILKNLRQQRTEIKKELDEVEPLIKEELESQGIDKMAFPDLGVKISYSKVNKSVMDEDKLISIVQRLIASDSEFTEDIKECIEYKPIINEQKLQELIYKGIVDINDIQPAYVDKGYKVLKISKLK